MIDVRKKLIDQANSMVNQTTVSMPSGDRIPELEEFLKDVISLALEKGFILGVNSMKQTAEYLLRFER